MDNWQLEWSDTFKKLYKKKDNSIKPLVKKKLMELAFDGPYKKGKKKKGLEYSNNAYGIKVDKSNRIIYEILDNEKIIRLLKVCDHKKVYNKD